MSNIDDSIAKNAAAVDIWLDRLLPADEKSELTEAMRYSLLSKGKRLRPFLLYEVGRCFELNEEVAHKLGSAIEMVHTYSLIHDDLPVLDNDDMRRGIPSCHKKFNEATAILAGNALLTLSFQIISEIDAISYEGKTKAINKLAKAAGYKGMLRGQEKDLAYQLSEEAIPTAEIEEMDSLKTGCLFGCATAIAAIAASQDDVMVSRLELIGMKLGVIFQLSDDLQDAESELTKNNLVSTLGREGVIELRGRYYDELIQKLESIPSNKNLLDLISKIADL